MYNLIDKPICLQDANQQGRQEWAYVKYDALGRVVTTGIQRSNTSTRAALQAAVTNGLTNSTYTEWEQPGTAVQGYSNTAYPISNEVPLTVNYYDGYTFTGKPSTFATPSGASAMTKGLLTATKTTVLNTMYNATPDMLWMVSFYDDLGRVTQSYSQHYLGGTLSIYNYDKVNSSYDFTNEVTATTRQHYIRNSTNSASVLNATIANGYSYDHMGRKMQTTETVSSGTRVILAQNSYNELGQLINKGLHSTDDVAFYQNIYYTYNERGWLMASTADLFTEKLQYNANPLNVSGFTAQYNGNIASQTRTAGAAPTTTSYAYTYDYLDRLTKAVSTDSYNESGIVYDLNGNITALQRTAGSSTPIDNLAYTYTNSAGTYTNQVQSITDAAADVSGNGYPQGAFAYGYDANGNISTDASKALNITAYNQLNLPQSVTLNGATITYTYDANGRKLRKTSTAGTGTTTDYIDGIEYDNGTLSFAQTEEGRVILAGGITNYEYNLGDNLGNVRLSFDTHLSTPTQTQQDDYYAFGYEISRGSTTSPKNEYLYNKKELQEEFTEYDYGARFYDPVIARWNTIDELAESFVSTSSYAYVLNNPIKLIDPDGRDTGKVIQLKEVFITAPKPAPKVAPEPEIEPLKYIETASWLVRNGPKLSGLGLFVYLMLDPMNDPKESQEGKQMNKAKHKSAVIQSEKSVEEVLEDAEPGRPTKGRAKQYEKDGGQDQADEDFDDLVVGPSLKHIPNGRIGQLPDGTYVNVRENSSDGRPTLEIQTKNPIKIRYKP